MMADLENINKILQEIKEDLKTKASNEKIDQLLRDIKLREERIVQLEVKVKKFDLLEARVAILENNNKVLERKIDDNEQYSRRSCLRINGIPLPENGKETGDVCLDKVRTVLKDLPGNIPDCMFDRAHRVGKTKTDDQGNVSQQMIVKMCSWKARTLIYRNRKVLKNHRCYLDLTKRRFNLKKLADKKIEGNAKVEFALADINCSISIKIKNGGFKYFNSEEELDKILLDLEIVG